MASKETIQALSTLESHSIQNKSMARVSVQENNQNNKSHIRKTRGLSSQFDQSRNLRFQAILKI
jgi:hypothetical protein